MAGRILAFVAAIAMVVGAVAIRNGNTDGDGEDGRAGRLQLVCATELTAVCEAVDGRDDVEVTIEAAGATADRLTSAESDRVAIDGWLAPGPWGAIVDAARGQAGSRPGGDALFAPSGEPLARSPFVLAVWKNRRPALGCAEPVGLGCVGDAMRSRGFRVGMAGDDQAEGLLADAALAAGHLGNPDFATNDFSETDLSDWLAVVDASADRVGRNPGGRSFTELLTFGAAAADGFLSVEAVIAPRLAGAARRGELDLAYVSPGATADVVYSPRPGDRGERLGKLLRDDRVLEALRTSGWRVPGKAGVAGVDASSPRLEVGDGLPSAGVLQALRNVVT